LIQIKDAAAAACDRGSMLKTYTMYLVDPDDRSRFEPALCESHAEAMRRARELLEAHPDCEAIDVSFGPDHLFRVGRQSA